MAQVYHIGLGVHICRPDEKDKHDSHLIKYSPQTIEFIWPTVEPWLQKTLTEAPPWWTLEDLKDKCLKGDLSLWVACMGINPHGVLLTGIDQYKHAKVCGVPWIGGNKMLLWIKTAQNIIEDWAKEAGCKWLVGSGREGWAKIADMEDYGPTLIKELK